MKTSRRRNRAGSPDAKETSGLSGWAGIEDTVAKDDEGKMEGYSEDVDTLLVFAGLFSAILSAFVVQTYQMLQPSSADLTNQLLTTNNQMIAQNNQILAQNNQILNQILVQGSSATLTVSTFSPPQLLSPTDPPPFQPSTPARWINILFFTSLVLSLAAALLGILVKQWVREYMQWNSPLASPRENVMVRQFRLEAWEAWNVSAVVSTVPALLEVAMILFLIGMVILLWTLDDVVAICLTAMTAMFLLVIAVFTVLPVFSRRCPYKSPTAWAVMAACRFMSISAFFFLEQGRAYAALLPRRWCYLIDVWAGDVTSGSIQLRITLVLFFPLLIILAVFFGVYDDNWDLEPQKHVEWKQLPLSWRDVDLRSCRSMLPRFGSRQLNDETMHTAAQAIVSTEASDGSERKDELFGEVKETVLLLRALSWVAKSSQNSHVVAYIEQCHDEEQRVHERTLDFLLRAAASGPGSEVRRLLLQFVLDQSKHCTTPALLCRAYIDARWDYRVMLSAADRHLVLERGHTTAADCELLLANYIPSEFTHAYQDRLEMFITTATVWLFHCDMQVASREVVFDILGRMIRAADVLSVESAAPADTAAGISQDGNAVDVRANHREWIRELYWTRATLTERYGALFRRLLHALEKAYKLDKLRGDEDPIRDDLHDALETSHNTYGSTCEVDGCPWIGHAKSQQDEGRNYVECDLLSKSVRPASAADAHSEERPSELRPPPSSGPQPSPSSEPVISSDPPQGLAHAEPHCTTSHDAPPAPAIRSAPNCLSSRSSLSATKHKPRRHAMGRVREARSMDELTRPEAARVEAGRRRSWG